MNLSNITDIEKYKPKVKIVTISPPGWIDTIKELKKNNWQDKHHLKVIYKCDKALWNCMKENNIIPTSIANDIESEKDKYFNID